jgi:hypothetical protein
MSATMTAPKKASKRSMQRVYSVSVIFNDENDRPAHHHCYRPETRTYFFSEDDAFALRDWLNGWNAPCKVAVELRIQDVLWPFTPLVKCVSAGQFLNVHEGFPLDYKVSLEGLVGNSPVDSWSDPSGQVCRGADIVI